MLCHRFNCIFVHIPKTGGQSVEHFFLEKMGLDWNSRGPLLLRSCKDPSFGPRSLAHLTAEEYVTLGHVAPIDFEKYSKFSVVRNPFDRLVSEYYYRYAKKMSFRQFVFNAIPVILKRPLMDRARHLLPQVDYICDKSGKMLMDRVIHFENLASGFREVAEEMGFTNAELPHQNKSSKRPERMHYSDLFDNNTRAYVEEMYREDLNRFDYSFDDKSTKRMVPSWKNRFKDTSSLLRLKYEVLLKRNQISPSR